MNYDLRVEFFTVDKYIVVLHVCLVGHKSFSERVRVVSKTLYSVYCVCENRDGESNNDVLTRDHDANV